MYKKYKQPIVQKTGGKFFKIVRDWKVQLSNGDTMVIKKGFVHDYTSVPKAIQMIFSKFSRGDVGAIAHDYIYSFKGYRTDKGFVPMTRKQADYEMAFLMRVYGDKPIRVTMFYIAVRLFGFTRWGKVIRQTV